jgi:hypothetical protein
MFLYVWTNTEHLLWLSSIPCDRPVPYIHILDGDYWEVKGFKVTSILELSLMHLSGSSDYGKRVGGE